MASAKQKAAARANLVKARAARRRGVAGVKRVPFKTGGIWRRGNRTRAETAGGIYSQVRFGKSKTTGVTASAAMIGRRTRRVGNKRIRVR